MKKILCLPVFLLLLLNCYLTDLEEYKYLEKHDDDSIYLVGTFSSNHLDFDDNTIHFIEFDFNFSIERIVYFNFFRADDYSQHLSSVRMVNNGIKIKKGSHRHVNQLLYNPKTTEDYFTLNVRAISEVDTIERSFWIHKRYVNLVEN